MKFSKEKLLTLLIVLSVVYPFLHSLRNILEGSIPFWYDPARDLLLALDNIRKPSLIGPPSGIPGVFYGPYWIWFISMVLLVSKDPRAVAIVLLLIPYFTIFPYILFRFSKVYDSKIILQLWLFFILSSLNYTTYIWNPDLAPLFFLLLVYLLLFRKIQAGRILDLLNTLLAGIVSGLLFNVHISFGLGIFIASGVFIAFRRNGFFVWRSLSQIAVFICGFFLTLFPFAVFEYRHNFLQTRAVLSTLLNAYIYNSASVGQRGLLPMEILYQLFVKRVSDMLSMRTEYILALYVVIIGSLLYLRVRKRLVFSDIEKRVLGYSGICILTLFVLYMTSRNPVYEYHFIGIEIIIILVLGIVIKKIRFIEQFSSFWVLIIALASFLVFLSPFRGDPRKISSLASKKNLIEHIYLDSEGQSFSAYAYSPAIYTYDYDYIFRWIGEKYKRFPEDSIRSVSTVYLIIPETSEAIMLDFVHSKTSDNEFYTVESWVELDGTSVIKRERL